MFKITKADLAKKTDSQLAALFQAAAEGFDGSGEDRASLLATRAMICREIARRAPR
jgi:hypothetical protein